MSDDLHRHRPRGRARAVAAFLIVAAAGVAAAPESVGGEPVRIAVYPPTNESRGAIPTETIASRIRDGFEARGFVVTDDAVLDRFLELHRVRWLGGVTPAVAEAARDVIDLDAVVVVTVLRVDDLQPPNVCLSVRWIDVQTEPRVEWMEVVALHGRDRLGWFGRKEVFRSDDLVAAAIDRIFDSFDREFFAEPTAPTLAAVKQRYAPRASASVGETPLLADRPVRVAVLPFRVDGTTDAAAVVLEQLFLRHLTKIPGVHVLDPGVVRDTLLRARIIMLEGPSLDQAEIIGTLADVDVEITGAVRTFQALSGRDSVPRVEFWTYGFEPAGRRFLWSSFSSNRGTDGVFFFRAGLIPSAERLAAEMSRAVVVRWLDRESRP